MDLACHITVQQSWGPEGRSRHYSPTTLFLTGCPAAPSSSCHRPGRRAVWSLGVGMAWLGGVKWEQARPLFPSRLIQCLSSSLSASCSVMLNPECWFTYLTLKQVQNGCQNLVLCNSEEVNEPQRADSRVLKSPLFWWRVHSPSPCCLAGSTSCQRAPSWV